MRSYTREAIIDKFNRIPKKTREEMTHDFKGYEIPATNETLKAYFVGILRAITYDVVACLENRGVMDNEQKELIEELMDKINSRIQ